MLLGALDSSLSDITTGPTPSNAVVVTAAGCAIDNLPGEGLLQTPGRRETGSSKCDACLRTMVMNDKRTLARASRHIFRDEVERKMLPLFVIAFWSLLPNGSDRLNADTRPSQARLNSSQQSEYTPVNHKLLDSICLTRHTQSPSAKNDLS